MELLCPSKILECSPLLLFIWPSISLRLNSCHLAATSTSVWGDSLSLTLDWRLVFISGLCFCDTYGPPPAEHAPSVQGWWQFQFPEAQENVPVKSRRPKPQIPDQGKNASQESRTLFLFRFRVGGNRTLPGPLIPHSSLAQLYNFAKTSLKSIFWGKN